MNCWYLYDVPLVSTTVPSASKVVSSSFVIVFLKPDLPKVSSRYILVLAVATAFPSPLTPTPEVVPLVATEVYDSLPSLVDASIAPTTSLGAAYAPTNTRNSTPPLL